VYETFCRPKKKKLHEFCESVVGYRLNSFGRGGGCPVPLQDAGLLEMVVVQGIL